ncbi:hypothetical protein G7K_3820-t1 [Saitoella complicata NRRL Y-17804]|uniref:Chitin-binding type-1 domain-containing protein n=1 Tax=Saitoella complicata (strain BCRC 22490 / CBS 7301 / JCM 7358 / NBRC 10748 / NRRL Y-17804) TaxID=698492 RepID=A0A0E9NIN3_SAICN|nr:hypothetical protein G7K_3820-t1 [Saitoella complicata NRRL Y-17804]
MTRVTLLSALPFLTTVSIGVTAHPHPRPISNLVDELVRRATTISPDNTCGGTNGYTCPDSSCCSQYGWCGTTTDYCGTGCQQSFSGAGATCSTGDAVTSGGYMPAGTNTSTVPRPLVGNVEYKDYSSGLGGIFECMTPGQIALTFDDGPYIYTDQLLEKIHTSYPDARVTFFITGNNIGKGPIDDPQYGWDKVITKMHNYGHQIASHTWKKWEMEMNEMALRNILGFFPTYMRPPFSSCTDASGCIQSMTELGYHIIYFDLDSDDYNKATPELVQNAKDNVRNAMKAQGKSPSTSSFLEIMHDIHEQTALNLTDYVMGLATQLGYKMVTVGECLGDPEANWYRASSPGSSFSSSSGGAATSSSSNSASISSSAAAASASGTTKTTTDGTCGGNIICGGDFPGCCSQFGWCGTTTDYCGIGCQSGPCLSSAARGTTTTKRA